MDMVVYPLALPGKCASCGYGGANRRYLDTKIDAEYYGVVYICESCLGDVFSKFGFTDTTAERRLGELQERYERLNELYLRCLAALNGITAFSVDSEPIAVPPTEAPTLVIGRTGHSIKEFS